ncbi:MAG: Aminopeptidase N-like protein [Candidatus Angelobacter sp.]|nr:Aminopeptidase N-like protein [Candidatus Angelobacter sp.]
MRLRSAFLAVSLSITCNLVTFAQELEKRPAEQNEVKPTGPAKAPNSDPMYQQLRNVGLSGETASANNLVLKRDAGEFTFKTGVFQFLAPVNGKVTGAVFLGTGSFSMVPPLWSEKHSLSALTKEQAIHEEFATVVLRFTDGTYEEIKKVAGTSTGNASGSGELDSAKHALRKKLHYNLDARILQDIMGKQQGGLFYAFIKGSKYNSKEIYSIDPNGLPEWAPEEVAFETWDDEHFGVWAAFHFSDEYKNGLASGTQRNASFAIEKQKLDTQIEKSGRMNGSAKTTLVALQSGLQVVPLDLFETLRVSSVTNGAGEQLSFIQEGKDDDYQFSVILPKPLGLGEQYVLQTTYSGKDAVTNEGGGNYFPVARTNWFPNTNEGNYSTYEMTFRIPKKMTMVATGTRLRATDEGSENVSEWKSEVPQAVAGFNFGNFKHLEFVGKDFTAEAYANENPPDWVRGLQGAVDGGLSLNPRSSGVALGTMDTTTLMKKPLAEAQVAMALYSTYFGASPYKRVAMTQQTACTFGQSWPALVYLPICVFFDGTVRHQLGLDDTRGYWEVVGPHEVAHQWWGHAVGWSSYRDQWMSEGFAEMSASLFIQATRNNQQFIKFWNDERDLITEKNIKGFRAIDVGPLTMGYRLDNSKVGGAVARRLIYPKGGYILHMVRMMMWDKNKGDDLFRDMMRDFVITYMNKPASTEDFKAMVEKHMTPQMDLDRNHKMDWFFNPYVYGTELPGYSLDQSINGNVGSDLNLKIKITQKNVSDGFKMLVPLYLELANGQVVKLGIVPIQGNNSIEQAIPLAVLKDRPKRAMINYYNDVLSYDK